MENIYPCFKALFSIGVSRGVVYSVGQDRIVPAFDLGARRLLYSLPTLNGFAYSLASNPVDPSIIALGAGDGIVRIWRTAAKQLFDVRQVKLNQSKVGVYRVSPGSLRRAMDLRPYGLMESLNKLGFGRKK